MWGWGVGGAVGSVGMMCALILGVVVYVGVGVGGAVGSVGMMCALILGVVVYVGVGVGGAVGSVGMMCVCVWGGKGEGIVVVCCMLQCRACWSDMYLFERSTRACRFPQVLRHPCMYCFPRYRVLRHPCMYCFPRYRVLRHPCTLKVRDSLQVKAYTAHSYVPAKDLTSQ